MVSLSVIMNISGVDLEKCEEVDMYEDDEVFKVDSLTESERRRLTANGARVTDWGSSFLVDKPDGD